MAETKEMEEDNQSATSEDTEKTMNFNHNLKGKAISGEEKKKEEGKEDKDLWDLERDKLRKLIGKDSVQSNSGLQRKQEKMIVKSNAWSDEGPMSGLFFWNKSSKNVSDKRRTIGEAIVRAEERRSGIRRKSSLFDLFVPATEPDFMKGLGEEMKASRYEDDNSTIATTETAAKELAQTSLLGNLYIQMALSGKSLVEEAKNTFASELSDLPGTAPISTSSDESSERRSSVFDLVSHKMMKNFFDEAEATLEDADEETNAAEGDNDEKSIFGRISIFSRSSTVSRRERRSMLDTLKLEANATEIQVNQEEARMKLEREVARMKRVVKNFPITNVSRHLKGRKIHDVIPYLVRNPGLKRDFRQKLIMIKPTTEEEVSSILEKFLIDKAEEIDQYMTDQGVPPPETRSRQRHSFSEGLGGFIKSVSGRILSIFPDEDVHTPVRRRSSVAENVLARFSMECAQDGMEYDDDHSYKNYSASLVSGCYDDNGKTQ